MSKNDSSSDYQKVKPKEFFDISLWVFKLIYSINPFYTIVYLLASVISRLRRLGYTYIFAKALDELTVVIRQPDATIVNLYPYLGIMFGFTVFSTLISLINSFSSRIVRTYSVTHVRRAFYLKLQSLGIQTLEQPDVNDKIHRANDTLRQPTSYLRQIINLASTTVEIVVAAAIVFNLIPVFIVVAILVSIPYLIFDKKMRSKFYKFTFDNTHKRRRAFSSGSNLSESATLLEITLSKATKFLDNKYLGFRRWYDKKVVRLLQNWSLGGHTFGLFRQIALFFGYVSIFKKFLGSKITIGNVAFWMSSLNILQDSLHSFIMLYNDLQEEAIRLKDTYTLFTMSPVAKKGNKNLAKLDKGPEIKVDNLSFNYKGHEKKVLRDINLHIKSGEKVAIVGSNGAGKTTLIKLICGIYQPSEGDISINDYNLKEVTSGSLYKNLGALFQEFNKYEQLTVRENIHIGSSDTKPDEITIRLAAQNADALEFIEEYPKGFNTILSEKYKGGIRPSSGQWQKIAIARFFYRNAPLVIFDEPTASIDAVSEYNIFNKIYKFFKGKTVIIISHRFSTVRNADRIIVIDKGKIVEEGTHEHLMSLKGKYAKAFLLQAEGYSIKSKS